MLVLWPVRNLGKKVKAPVVHNWIFFQVSPFNQSRSTLNISCYWSEGNKIKKGFSKYFLGFKKIFWKKIVQPTITHQNRVILVMVKYFLNIHKNTLLCLIYTRIINSIWELFWMILQSKSMNVIVWLDLKTLSQKKMLSSENFASKKIWDKKNFGPKKTLKPKNV